VASSGEGDCAFEDDACGWNNPERRENLDELNWDRVEARDEGRFPQADHTTGTREGEKENGGQRRGIKKGISLANFCWLGLAVCAQAI